MERVGVTWENLDCVEFVGQVEGEKKYDLLAGCSFGVFPSRFEGFGIVALEMLAVGKAVLCFDIDGLKWIPNDKSIKVKPYDIDVFSQMVELLISSKTKRESLGKEGSLFAKRFGWQNIIEEYEKVIKENTT